MPASRLACAVAALAWLASAARADDPVTVELAERATARSAVVTVGDVARVTGGDAATRAAVARLDLAELNPREQTAALTRRSVEYRLRLAGFDPPAVSVVGAGRVTVAVARRAVTADEVVAEAKAELLRRLPASPAGGISVELTQPVAVRLPEVPENDRLSITAVPHSPVTGPGRIQMDVTVSAAGGRLLSLPVYLEAKAGRPAGAVVPAGGTMPAPTEILVRARERVAMVVRSGALTVTAVGEAQQDGRLGQNVVVQNIDSKKTVSGRVSGAGQVDVDLTPVGPPAAGGETGGRP